MNDAPSLTMGSTITVKRVMQYGAEVFYPICDKALALADIAGTRTLTTATLQKAARLGFVVVLAAPAASSWNFVKEQT